MMSENEIIQDVDETCWFCSSPGTKQHWCIICDHLEAACTCPPGYQQLWDINRCTQCSATW